MSNGVSIRTTVSINRSDLIDTLRDGFDHDELAELIEELDQAVGDWDFSDKLIALGKKLELAHKEDFGE